MGIELAARVWGEGARKIQPGGLPAFVSFLSSQAGYLFISAGEAFDRPAFAK
jgi:hypothetical protein